MVAFAGKATLGFYQTPANLIEVMDQRMESLARPVARQVFAFTIAAGDTVLTKPFKLNGKIEQITLDTPTSLDGGTATFSVNDSLNVELYTSGAKNENTLTKCVTADTFAYLDNYCSATMTLSKAQATAVTVYAIVYVR